MRLLYDIGIRIYWFGIFIASAFNTKARLWIRGRRSWRREIQNQFRDDEEVIWFHCASLGEFEQGRPIIEEVRRLENNLKILLTFSSPSGYEKRKDFAGADLVTYLPLDTRRNARLFIDSIPLRAVCFIKYEFWYHYLRTLKKHAIPVYLASGIFRSEQIFFKWYGKWYRKFLEGFTHMFVQQEATKTLLAEYELHNVTVAGDTRFDRVARIVDTPFKNEAIEKFVDGSTVILAGSTWEPDDKLLAYAYRELPSTFKWIIAPHELSQKHIKQLKSAFRESILYTEIEGDIPEETKVVIVNTIGQLSYLYRFGSLAYIGGGFGKGIHNILEAATYGLPVVFGPKFGKFSEAIDLVNLKAAFPVHSKEELLSTFQQFLLNEQLLKTTSYICQNYVRSKLGATALIVEMLLKKT